MTVATDAHMCAIADTDHSLRSPKESAKALHVGMGGGAVRGIERANALCHLAIAAVRGRCVGQKSA